ncbi:tumor necrosis factor receptor superfamily member 6 isoform X2 [Myripristis murdjan]|uniref:tumor necrosis factor receptor superfamily member 6 isoform X2 n=1 Tax=Myripristis murdjan TaxID=586833 RepID=UPI00117621DA|nr:tumor necrosis factor receptor superfamily member 6-like isoform X2 [Myripristis murdjan]
MMASNSFSAFFSVLFFFTICLPWVTSSAPPQTKAKDTPVPLYQALLTRVRRQGCQDGEYQHEGKTCCFCPAGQHLVNHCTENHGQNCKICEDGKYMSHPNIQTNCDTCTSCSHRSANLEEKEPCTVYRNRVCQCKDGFYCTTPGCVTCRLCEECGDRGVKVKCKGTVNTICNDQKQGTNPAAIIVPVLFAVVVAALLVVLYLRWKKKLCWQEDDASYDVTNKPAEVLELLPGVDLFPFLPEIANLMEWTVMRDVAVRSGMPLTAIDVHEENHPRDRREQIFHLLREWVEREGKEASKQLVKTLQDMGKRNTAEAVVAIINSNGNAGGNV